MSSKVRSKQTVSRIADFLRELWHLTESRNSYTGQGM